MKPPRKFLVEVVHLVVVSHIIDAESLEDAERIAMDREVPDGDAEIEVTPCGIYAAFEAT